jgi:TPR repeat protein
VDSSVQTNSLAATNALPQISAEEDAANVALLEKQAAAGSSDAQLTLSLYFRYGAHGLKKSEDKADMLLEMSALQGNFGAQNLLKQQKEKIQKLEKDEPASDSSKVPTTQ